MKKLIAGILLLTAIGTGIWVLYQLEMMNLPETKKEETNRLRNEIVQISLTKWVFDHSSRISEFTARTIVQESLKTHKPLLVLALTFVESEFVPTAISSKGAIGLTQVMYDTHKVALLKLGIAKNRRDLFDVKPSIRAGSLILDECSKQSSEDISKTLDLYLGGKDGHYKNRILENLANLYVLVQNQ